MILQEFSSTPTQSINKLNKRLNEQYGITVKQRVYSREKLEQLRESAVKNVKRLKEQNHKFQLDPEYAKFLGVKDVTEIMLREGIYEGGRAYMRAEQFIRDTLDDLIQERGYDDQHARQEAMNRCRMQADALPDSIYEEILERCMMEMTSAGGIALEEDDEDLPQGNIHQQIQDLLDRGERVVSRALGRMGEIIGASDEQVRIRSMSSDHSAFTSFLDGDPVVLQRQSDGVWYVENVYEEALNEGVPPISEDEIRDFVTNEIGNGVSFLALDENEYEYTIELSVPAGPDNFAAEIDGEEFGRFKTFLWELCDDIGCVDVQGPEFISSYEGEEIWMWRLMKDIGSEEELRENVNVDEAEVVMALRAQSNVLADQIEKLGRMINEDLLKIAEQIGNEMGQDLAQQVQSSVTDALSQHLESARAAKEAMDAVVQSVAQGQAPGEVSPDLDAEAPADDLPDMDLDLDDEEMADAEADAEMDGAEVNEPAASGPEDAPMGRREI